MHKLLVATLGYASLWASLVGCYAPPKPDCGFVCSTIGECPEDYHCASDNRCHLNGTPASLICAADAGTPIIDARIDAPIDVLGLDADVTAPTVESTVPTANATGVSVDTTVTVVFSEAVINVDTNSFSVSISSSPVTGMVMMMTTPTTWVFTPDAPLPNNQTIDVTLTNAITDGAGNPLVTVTFSFDT